MNNELISTELPSFKKNLDHDLEAIKRRLSTGFYDDEKVLDELAATLLEERVLEENIALHRKVL